MCSLSTEEFDPLIDVCRDRLMRVTFLMPGYVWGPSGGIRVVYEYANRLVSRGHHVTVVHPRRLKCVVPPENETAYQWVRGRVNGFRNLLLKPSIDWHPLDNRVNLLFVPSSDVRYLPDGDAIFAAGFPTVQSVLECPETKGEKCYLIQGYEAYHAPKELVHATWRSSLHKVVIAKWLVELGNTLGCKNLTYVPNAIDHTRYRLTRPIEGRPRQVAMLFSTAQIKGARDGIEALRMAREKYPDLKVVFFGVSRQQSWIPKWVKYYRNPPQKFLVDQIYNQSSVLLAPSWCEGSPLPPAEAACCGCAVVATDIGGFREYIQHGVTGLLSPAKDSEALAENLCLLLGNEDLRVRLAKACNSFVSGLSWEHSTDLLEHFMLRVTHGCHASR